MAEARGRGGLGWLWLLLAYMVFIGAFALALAYIFPEGIDFSRPAEIAPSLEVATPVEEEAIALKLQEVVDDPTPYFGRDVIAIVRVNDILTDRVLWLGDQEDASRELFAVVARGIDLRASDFRVWQLIKVYGSVRPLEEAELKAQGLEIGRRISRALSSEKGYLLIRGLVPNSPDPQWEPEEEEPEFQEELEGEEPETQAEPEAQQELELDWLF